MATTTQPTLAEALADLPPRVRVHDLARRAGLNSKDTIAALAGAGVDVASASSAVDQDVAEALLTALLGGVAEGAAETAAAPAKSARGRKPAAGKGDAAQSGAGKGAAPKTGSAKAGAAKGSAAKAEAAKFEAARTEDAADGEAAEKPARGARAASGRKAPAAKAGSQKGSAQKDAPQKAAAEGDGAPEAAIDDEAKPTGRSRSRRGRGAQAEPATEAVEAESTADEDAAGAAAEGDDEQQGAGRSRRRRRGGRGRRGGRSEAGAGSDADEDAEVDEAEASVARAGSREDTVIDDAAPAGGDEDDDDDENGEGGSSRRRRRRRRRRGGSGEGDADADEPTSSRQSGSSGSSGSSTVQGVKGSTRLEAKRQRRRDSRETRRRPQILSEAEFLARRESVDRVMAVRQRGDLTQVALLEDGILVEHFVSQQGNASMIGNVYVGRVQNVLPSMEAAFVDIGKGRNAVLYAGEVNWDIAGLEGKERRIETALASGDTVLVQVSKDPVGHKGARLTTQISLPGRFLVFVPDGGATGISRKLPDNERKRLKKVLDKIVPPEAGVIIRTAAEGVGEDELAADVARLRAQWEQISADAQKAKDAGSAPKQLYAEPDTLIKVVRDLFNSDINRLLIDGDAAWKSLSEYVLAVAPELADRVSRYVGDKDVFAAFRIDEQIAKALQRKVRLPSGGSLVIDRTEAMTVVDVNTGKFTGSGGNLEETVTRNNLEAAEEIVRQLRLRDIGGIIVVDFIDMVLESNRDLVLRRLTECLGRDRTRHQVAEVTSLGLVQMTRKKMGLGLVEAFSEPCAACAGRGIVLHDSPAAVEDDFDAPLDAGRARKGRRRGGRGHDDDGARFEPLVVERVAADAKPDPRGPRPPALFRSEDHGDAAAPAETFEAVAVDADGEVVEVTTDTAVAEETAEAVVALAEPRGRSRGGRSRGGRGRGGAAGDDAAQRAAGDGAVAVIEGAGPAETVAPEAAASDAVSSEEAPAQKTRGRSSRSAAKAKAEPAPKTEPAPAAAEPASAAPAQAAPTRRRRAAGRPAGAPTAAATAVDLVLPAVGAAAE